MFFNVSALLNETQFHEKMHNFAHFWLVFYLCCSEFDEILLLITGINGNITKLIEYLRGKIDSLTNKA